MEVRVSDGPRGRRPRHLIGSFLTVIPYNVLGGRKLSLQASSFFVFAYRYEGLESCYSRRGCPECLRLGRPTYRSIPYLGSGFFYNLPRRRGDSWKPKRLTSIIPRPLDSCTTHSHQLEALLRDRPVDSVFQQTSERSTSLTCMIHRS